MNPINFNQYDKISDDLYVLGNNTILRFSVSLSKKMEDGNRNHFHKEYKYSSNKYNEPLITIRRSFDYYLSIENIRKTESGDKEFIMIRVQDMYYFKSRIQEAMLWFTHKKYENLYANANSKLVLLGGAEPITITGLSMEKYISIEPIVCQYDNKYSMGVRLSLSSTNNYVDMFIDKFLGFVYLIESINMYQSAQILLNYLQRPDYGTNMYEFNNHNDYIEQEEGYVTTKNNNRTLPCKNKQKSFFDKIDSL